MSVPVDVSTKMGQGDRSQSFWSLLCTQAAAKARRPRPRVGASSHRQQAANPVSPLPAKSVEAWYGRITAQRGRARSAREHRQRLSEPVTTVRRAANEYLEASRVRQCRSYLNNMSARIKWASRNRQRHRRRMRLAGVEDAQTSRGSNQSAGGEDMHGWRGTDRWQVEAGWPLDRRNVEEGRR